MLKVDDLKSQYKAAFSSIISNGLEAYKLNSFPVKSELGDKEAENFAKTFDEIFSNDYTNSLAGIIDTFIKNIKFTGTFHLKGTKVVQRAKLVKPAQPSQAGIEENTLKVNTFLLDELTDQLSGAGKYMLINALEACILNSFPVKSELGDQTAKSLAEGYADLLIEPLSKSIMSALDYYVKNIYIEGTVITTGPVPAKTGIIKAMPVPETNGKVPLTLGIRINKVDDLKKQLQSSLEYYIKNSSNATILNSYPCKSELGDNTAESLSKCLIDIIGEPLAEAISFGVDYYVKNMALDMVVISKGGSTNHYASITGALNPATAGISGIPNTIGIS